MQKSERRAQATAGGEDVLRGRGVRLKQGCAFGASMQGKGLAEFDCSCLEGSNQTKKLKSRTSMDTGQPVVLWWLGPPFIDVILLIAQCVNRPASGPRWRN